MSRNRNGLAISQEYWGNLIGQIYEAAIDAEKWNEVLIEIGKPLNCHCGNLIDISKDSVLNLINFTDGYVHSAVVDIDQEVTQGINPKVNYIKNLPGVTYWSDANFTSEKEMAASPYYREGSPKVYETYFGGGLVLRNSVDELTAIGNFRQKSEGIFGPREARFYANLAPHLERALELSRLQTVNRLKDRIEFGLQTINCAALVLNRSEEVVYMNENCKNIVQRNDGISIRKRKLLIEDRNAKSNLVKEFRSLQFDSDYSKPARFGYIKVRRKGNQPAYNLIVSPLTKPEHRLSGLWALVGIIEPQKRDLDAGDLLMQLYGLTKTESRVVISLCQGLTLSQYAERNQVTREAVRFHLKNVFSKTGVRRQTELVKLVIENLNPIESLKNYLTESNY